MKLLKLFRTGTLLIIIVTITMLCACGKKTADKNTKDASVVSSENLFNWSGNIISSINENVEMEELIIPAKCEGFSGEVFKNVKVKTVRFEDDDDIQLNSAFLSAESIEEIYLPKNLKVIDYMSFQMCTNLSSIIIPESVEQIRHGAFRSCKSLKEIVFKGSKIKTIEKEAFAYCESLETIQLPDSIETIERDAFYKCSKLKNVKIPKALSTIASNAFAATAITEIHIPAEVELKRLDASAFGTNTFEMTVYVKSGSYCDLNRDNWALDFKEIITE